MPYRTIKQWPSKVLSRQSELASLEEIKSVSVDLIDTLRAVSGAGLAAPQIGISKKVMVVDTSKFDCDNPDKKINGSHYWIISNPVITNQSGEWRWKEACLSVPIITPMVTRFETLTLEYDDLNGERKTLELEAPLSLAVQHEADHLEGKTILDRVGKNSAFLYKRKIRKSILKSIREQRELEKIDEPKIGRPKKKAHLSAQEVKKRKKNRLRNQKKK